MSADRFPPARLRELGFGSPRNKRRPRERGPRRADERAKAVRDGDAEAGRAVAVERRKLCAEVANDERRNRPLPVVTRIV
jgi:hypothetical protein